MTETLYWDAIPYTPYLEGCLRHLWISIIIYNHDTTRGMLAHIYLISEMPGIRTPNFKVSHGNACVSNTTNIVGMGIYTYM